ncbi:MAG: 3-hydroxyacyl-ACP dehydratase FabZ [Deltaproteobacteria bacterium]|nr:3-hydroxyacyl-ACP dehydratase FabZ [Deltaproteobacteria bacterium]
MIDFDEILQILPHRPPMLLVDAVIEFEAGKRAVGLHTVTEEDCAGHFPGNPVMPGVKIAEALAQVAAIIFLAEPPEHHGHPVYLVGLDKFRFRKPVLPGQKLRLEVALDQARRGLYRFAANATVDGERVANGTIMAAAPETPPIS